MRNGAPRRSSTAYRHLCVLHAKSRPRPVSVHAPDDAPLRRLAHRTAVGDRAASWRRSHVSTPDALRQHLDILTAYLDTPGVDLNAILDVLLDDITEAVPSFLGLELTITVAGFSTTLTTLPAHLAPEARASLMLPLTHLTDGAAPDDSLILFAEHPRSFLDMARVVRTKLNLDDAGLVDRHLPPSVIHDGGTTADDFQDDRMINIGLGVLLDRGFPPEQAAAELARRARRHGGNLAAAAAELLDSL
ncbi:MAG: hypothetical protein U0R72_13615 [Nakamurella multipartita]